MDVWFWSWSERSKKEFDSFSVLKYFTIDNMLALSWKKKDAFLHVIEDILGVFNELHVKPYLNLLMGCVVRMLWSCTSIIDRGSSGFPIVEIPSSFRDMHERGGGAKNQIMVPSINLYSLHVFMYLYLHCWRSCHEFFLRIFLLKL